MISPLSEKLPGWTIDNAGTIHTPSGYKTSPQLIESALWLFGCWSNDSRLYLIHSDEEAGALRPLYELSDVDPTGTIPPIRLRIDQSNSGLARSVHAARPRQAPDNETVTTPTGSTGINQWIR